MNYAGEKLSKRVHLCLAAARCALALVFQVPEPAHAGLFTPTGSLHEDRDHHTATLLGDGKVLVAGGWYTNTLSSAELYDSATGLWTLTGPLNNRRYGHTATPLPNGKVLVAGGDIIYVDGVGHILLDAAELYPGAYRYPGIGRQQLDKVEYWGSVCHGGRSHEAAVESWGGYSESTFSRRDSSKEIVSGNEAMHPSRCL